MTGQVVRIFKHIRLNSRIAPRFLLRTRRPRSPTHSQPRKEHGHAEAALGGGGRDTARETALARQLLGISIHRRSVVLQVLLSAGAAPGAGGPWVCGDCGRAYQWKVNLGRHQRYECSGARRFHCFSCVKSYKRHDHLLRHCALAHAGLEAAAAAAIAALAAAAAEDLDVKPSLRYTCQRCFRTYGARRSLWRHEKFECGKEPMFQCRLCFKKMTRKQTLLVHMQMQHGQEGVQQGQPQPPHPPY